MDRCNSNSSIAIAAPQIEAAQIEMRGMCMRHIYFCDRASLHRRSAPAQAAFRPEAGVSIGKATGA
jgi:hypothetical protein